MKNILTTGIGVGATGMIKVSLFALPTPTPEFPEGKLVSIKFYKPDQNIHTDDPFDFFSVPIISDQAFVIENKHIHAVVTDVLLTLTEQGEYYQEMLTAWMLEGKPIMDMLKHFNHQYLIFLRKSYV